MEHLELTNFEHIYLQKHKFNLEANYNIKIDLPEVDKKEVFCSRDVIFACIHGEGKNIEIVKNLMKERSSKDKCVAVITLSDSDTPDPPQNRARRKKKRKRANTVATPKPAVTSTATESQKSNSTVTVTVTESNNSKQVQVGGAVSSSSSLQPAEVFIPLSRPGRKRGRSKKKCYWTPKRPRLSPKPQIPADDSIILLEDDAIVLDNSVMEVSANDSVIILEDNPPLMPEPVVRPLFVPEPIVQAAFMPVPMMVVPRPLQMRVLRPIVIDGSNVAREHGRGSNTYSCRGIQLAVDFFVQRGHLQVTAFVPNFRRYKVHGPVPTTHPEVLEELAKGQRVAFTPSRTLHGKRLTCYDDRFIVELASTTDGVILSNDNYRDLVGESEAFRKTIEERLLLYCFVGDKLMIPQDPLGRNGPTLDTYLSLPSAPPGGAAQQLLP